MGERVSFSGAEASDADGEIAHYEWNFGDGKTGSGATLSHTYATPGRYQVTLRVDDGMSVSNSTNEITKIIAVNQPPQAEAGLPRIVCPGSEVVFDGTASVDRDGKLIRYEWEFGNGMRAEGATVTNVFADPGTYQVKLLVTDDSGTQCAQSESSSWVKVNALPVAVAGADRTALVGGVYDAILFDATKSQDPDQEPLTYVWEFGDGVAETGAKVFHRYAQPGQYKARLRVRDSSGLHCGEAWDEVVVEAKDRK